MEGAFRPGDLTDPALRLIETVLWDGVRAPRWALHLDRLVRSAARLGFVCDPAAVTLALQAAPAHAARLRLTLARDGAVEVTVAALPPVAGVWRVGLARARLASGDPWLTVKSTRRAAYDLARAGLAAGIDEVVFLNERGEVCDGTITSVFFDRGGGLRTPPLAAGLLPGVLRAEMLAAGQVREETLPASDLPRVRLWVGNALRGMIAAAWVGQDG